MNLIETALASPFAQSLGWALIHFVWQGCGIALLYLVASLFVRRRDSNVRYAVACSALLLMLLAPAITMVIRLQTAADLASTQGLDPSSFRSLEQPIGETFASRETPSNSVSTAGELSIVQQLVRGVRHSMPWLLGLWFSGVMFLSIRFGGGLLLVSRLRRESANAEGSIWQQRVTHFCERLRISRAVLVCESMLVEVPTVVGWLRPVVLIPVTALTGLSPEQLEALLAHELAHVRRYDYLVNLAQTAIETLLFYHPAVWWISKQVREEREHCCDDLAVAVSGNVLLYAKALTALEQIRAPQPHLMVAANGGSLLIRIQRLLKGRAPARNSTESVLVGLTAVAALALVLAASHSPVASSRAQAAIVSAPTVLELPEIRPSASAPQTAKPAPIASIEPREPTVADQPTGDNTSLQPGPEEQPALQAAADDRSRDYAAQLTAAGLKPPNEEELNALRANRITPQIVQELSAALSNQLEAHEVIAMRIHGVSSEFIGEMKSHGFPVTAEMLIAFRIHGVDSRFVSEMRDAGLAKTNAEELIAFRIHGVNAVFIKEMSDLGFTGLTGETLTAFRIHGVTAPFVQAMRGYFGNQLSPEDLVAFRIQGVTPDLIKSFEGMGFRNLSGETLLAFRIHGVTPSFTKSIRDLGFPNVTEDQLVALRIHSVTPEFIQTVRSRGFTDVTLDQLIELRRLRMMPSGKKTN